MDCAKCTALTPEYVNTASSMALHRLTWTDSVGEIPPNMNYLVGEDQPDVSPKIIHWTNGGPWLDEYKAVDYGAAWDEERNSMTSFKNE